MIIKVIRADNKSVIENIRKRAEDERAKYHVQLELGCSSKDTAYSRMKSRYRLLNNLKGMGWETWVLSGKKQEFDALAPIMSDPN